MFNLGTIASNMLNSIDNAAKETLEEPKLSATALRSKKKKDDSIEIDEVCILYCCYYYCLLYSCSFLCCLALCLQYYYILSRDSIIYELRVQILYSILNLCTVCI